MYWERQTDNCSIISDASLLPAIEQNCFWLCRYRTRVVFHVFPSPECYNSCVGQWPWPHLKIQPCCESIKSEGCRCPKLAAMVHLQWHLKKVENVTYVRIIPIWRQVWKHTFAISPTRPVHQIGHSSPSTIGAGYSTAVEGSGELFTRVEFHFFLLLPCPLPWGDFEITTNTKILIAGNV